MATKKLTDEQEQTIKAVLLAETKGGCDVCRILREAFDYSGLSKCQHTSLLKAEYGLVLSGKELEKYKQDFPDDM